MAPATDSVIDFGASGDGETDDTAAVQRAVDAGVGNVRFPPGTYRLTRPVEVDLDAAGPVSVTGSGTARLRMEGSGPALRLVGTHEGTADPRTVAANVWESQRLPLVDGLEIVGDHPEAVGLEATGTMQLTVTRLLVRDALHGIHLTTRNRNVVVSGCHVYDNRGIGVYLDDVDLHQIDVTASHVSYNDGGGIVVRDGNVRNLQVGSCDIESNMGADGPPAANVSVEMTEGSMREGAVVGCTLQHTGDAPESANVRFDGHGSDDRRKAGNFVVANNALSDVRHNVHVRHGRGIVVAGNTFWKGYDHDVLVEESSNVVLSSNLHDRNPDYGGGTSRNGIAIRDSHDVALDGLHVVAAADRPAGIELDGCRNYRVADSTVLNCDGCGVLLDGTEHGVVSGNVVRDDRPDGAPVAIRVRGGTGNLVATNYAGAGVDADSGAAAVTGNYSG